MYDMMLVDESKDMGGIPGAAVQRVAEIRRSLLEGFKSRATSLNCRSSAELRATSKRFCRPCP